jgi:hypothetical protein
MLHAKAFCAISRRILTQRWIPLHGQLRRSHPKAAKAWSDKSLGRGEPERFDMIELVAPKFQLQRCNNLLFGVPLLRHVDLLVALNEAFDRLRYLQFHLV